MAINILTGLNDGGAPSGGTPALTGADVQTAVTNALVSQNQIEFSETLLEDNNGVIFIAVRTVDEENGNISFSYRTLAGTSYTPVGAISLPSEKNHVISTSEYKALATNTTKGFTLGDALQRVDVINLKTNTVIGTTWRNLTTGASVTGDPLSPVEAKPIGDDSNELLTSISNSLQSLTANTHNPGDITYSGTVTTNANYFSVDTQVHGGGHTWYKVVQSVAQDMQVEQSDDNITWDGSNITVYQPDYSVYGAGGYIGDAGAGYYNYVRITGRYFRISCQGATFPATASATTVEDLDSKISDFVQSQSLAEISSKLSPKYPLNQLLQYVAILTTAIGTVLYSVNRANSTLDSTWYSLHTNGVGTLGIRIEESWSGFTGTWSSVGITIFDETGKRVSSNGTLTLPANFTHSYYFKPSRQQFRVVTTGAPSVGGVVISLDRAEDYWQDVLVSATESTSVTEEYWANSTLSGSYTIGDKLINSVNSNGVSMWYNATAQTTLTSAPSTAIVRYPRLVVQSQSLIVTPATADSPAFPSVNTTQGVSASLTVPTIDGIKANYFTARAVVGSSFNGAFRGNDGVSNRFLPVWSPGGTVTRLNVNSNAVSSGIIPNEINTLDFVSWSTVGGTVLSVEFRYIPDQGKVNLESLPISPFIVSSENAVTSTSTSITVPTSINDGRVYIRTTGASGVVVFGLRALVSAQFGTQFISEIALPNGTSFGYIDIGAFHGTQFSLVLKSGFLTNFDVQYYFNNTGS